jgi:hypothetical protein
LAAPVEEDDDDYHAKLSKLDSKLKGLFPDQDAIFKTEMELLIMVHYGRPLAEACKFLEGDYVTLPFVEHHWRKIQRTLSFGTNDTVALDEKIMAHLRDHVRETEIPHWVQWCRDRIKPAMDYFTTQEVKHDSALRLANAAALFCPWIIAEKNPTQAAVEEKMRRFGFFSTEELNKMKEELDDYKTAAVDVAITNDLTPFWKRRVNQLPGWSSAFFKVGLIQASSAKAERGFSQFEKAFGRNVAPETTEQYMELQMKIKNDQ